MYKIYFDTEFTGLVKNTSLISIGLVTEDGDKFYGELTDYNESLVDDWLKKNVISKLLYPYLSELPYDSDQDTLSHIRSSVVTFIGDKEFIKTKLLSWLDKIYKSHGKMCFISDALAYDWVLFNDLLFGSALNIPSDKMYYIPFDICTMFEMLNIDPDISREEFAEVSDEIENKHNAMQDAEVIKKCYDKLMKIQSQTWKMI